jgi:hypothetical protein
MSEKNSQDKKVVPGESSWDLVVRSQKKNWKSGKGYEYKVSLLPTSKDGPQVKLEVTSSNPGLFQFYPQDEIFTVKVKDCEQ